MKTKYLVVVLIVVTSLSSFYENEKCLNSYTLKNNIQVTYMLRKATIQDKENLKTLYQRVAAIPGGLARTKNEITDDYITKMLSQGINSGLILVAEYERRLIGCMVALRLDSQVFAHILTECSILIDPDFQKKGIGSNIILTFLSEIRENNPEILRIELIARESNPAIALYEKLGFKKEGKFERRIKGVGGKLEADIPLVWMNPTFSL